MQTFSDKDVHQEIDTAEKKMEFRLVVMLCELLMYRAKERMEIDKKGQNGVGKS